MANEAAWERLARIVLGVALLIAGFGVMDGGAGAIVGIVGFIPLLTGLSGWCPMYALFGIRTNKPHSDAAAH